MAACLGTAPTNQPHGAMFAFVGQALRLPATDAVALQFDGTISGSSGKTLPGRAVAGYFSLVRTTPGTLQHGGASFATTHWSVIAQSALTDVPEAASALAQLCEMYWPPIYSFIRRRGYSPADAQDLTQSFFAYFLPTKAYARTDPLHGKFRSFLLASVKNFLADNWDCNQAIRRGGGYQFIPLDPEKAEALYDAASAIS